MHLFTKKKHKQAASCCLTFVLFSEKKNRSLIVSSCVYRIQLRKAWDTQKIWTPHTHTHIGCTKNRQKVLCSSCIFLGNIHKKSKHPKTQHKYLNAWQHCVPPCCTHSCTRITFGAIILFRVNFPACRKKKKYLTRIWKVLKKVWNIQKCRKMQKWKNLGWNKIWVKFENHKLKVLKVAQAPKNHVSGD